MSHLHALGRVERGTRDSGGSLRVANSLLPRAIRDFFGRNRNASNERCTICCYRSTHPRESSHPLGNLHHHALWPLGQLRRIYAMAVTPPRHGLGPRWFAPSSIPPILLLTVVTSFAFNHALISTQRAQDVRTHRIRTTLLHDTIDYNARLLHLLNPPTSSAPRARGKEQAEWIAEERESLIRRWRALGLDPVHEKLLSPNPNATEEQAGTKSVFSQTRAVGPKEITWSEIFLGSKEKRSSLTERWQKVTAGISDSFTQLNPNTSRSQTNTSAEEEKELEELSRLWSSLSKQS